MVAYHKGDHSSCLLKRLAPLSRSLLVSVAHPFSVNAEQSFLFLESVGIGPYSPPASVFLNHGDALPRFFCLCGFLRCLHFLLPFKNKTRTHQLTHNKKDERDQSVSRARQTDFRRWRLTGSLADRAGY